MAFLRRLLAARGDCCNLQLPIASLALVCGAVTGGAAQLQCESLPSAELSGSGGNSFKPHGCVVRSNTVKATWVHWSHHGEKRMSMVCKPVKQEVDRQSSHAALARTTCGVSEESYRRRAMRTFEIFAAEDGKLAFADVMAAVQIFSVGRVDEGLPLVLGPLLWRMMGKKEHDGGATFEEFMGGQELLTAARSGDLRSDKPTRDAIEELCWRAMTANSGGGTVGRAELSLMVRTMLHLDGLDGAAMDEINRTWSAKKVRMHKTGNGYFTTFPQEAIEYYMNMCDLDGDGIISREDFSKCSSLQHNFWSLLSKPELEPISLIRGYGNSATAILRPCSGCSVIRTIRGYGNSASE